MQSIGRRLDDHNGIGPGFDGVRLCLATMVLFIHMSLIAPGVVGDEAAPLFGFLPVQRWAFNFAAVPMFFALSGFLVAASADRLPLAQFLINRLLRIIPALAVEIVLSALILGTLLTTLPLSHYFSDARFFSYFLNIVGSVHYELPGVFASNPEPNIVNGSLWTVPHELGCYVMVAILALVGIYRRPMLLLAVTVGLFLAAIVVFLAGSLGHPLPFQEKLSYVFVTRGAARLIPIFLVGMTIYRFRYVIPFRGSYAVAAFIGYFAVAAFGPPAWQVNPIFNFLVTPLLSYAVISAGLSTEFKLDLFGGGDYSYGIYLYGFPLQQAIIAALPGLQNVAAFMLLSIAAAVGMAAFSWHVVEKPILRLRRRYSVAAQIHTGPKTASAATATTPVREAAIA